MTVKKGSKVKVEYEGKFENGEVFDSSNKTGEQRPLEFVAGEGHVIPGFDNAVLGMEKDEEKDVEINPEEGYGQLKEELKHEVPKDALPKEQEPKKGMMLIMTSPQGQQIPGVIEDVKDNSVILNLNHPLAGKKLLFKIKVVDISEPESQKAN